MSRPFASWNQIGGWLRRLDTLRRCTAIISWPDDDASKHDPNSLFKMGAWQYEANQ